MLLTWWIAESARRSGRGPGQAGSATDLVDSRQSGGQEGGQARLAVLLTTSGWASQVNDS